MGSRKTLAGGVFPVATTTGEVFAAVGRWTLGYAVLTQPTQLLVPLTGGRGIQKASIVIMIEALKGFRTGIPVGGKTIVGLRFANPTYSTAVTISTEISTAGIVPLFSSQCVVFLSSGQPTPGP
jgi:hypothetical protein